MQEKVWQNTNDSSLNKAVQKLRDAINNPGSHPYYHYAQVERLKKDWPVLWGAIQDVVKHE